VVGVDLGGVALPALLVGVDGSVERVHDPAGELFGPGAEPDHLDGAFPGEPDLRARLMAGGVVRLQVRRPDGTPCPADVTVVPTTAGALLCLVRVLPPDRLVDETRQALDVAFQTAPIGMAMYDTDGYVVRVNDAMCAMLRRPASAFLGQRDQAMTHPDDRQADLDAAWRILRGEMDVWQTEKRFIAGDGGIVWVIANLTFLRDDAGRPLAWLGQFTDVTDRTAREGEWRRRADHDDLTGVASRRRILDALVAADPAAGGSGGSVLLVDLDGFKAVNDGQGHPAGDQLLVLVARALEEVLAASCPRALLGRMGGDEFLAVCPGQVEPSATAAALREAVARASGGQLGASVGTAAITAEGADVALRAADDAMYVDKRRRAARARCAETPAAPPPTTLARPGTLA
jgi:diguanylate cyclase (GGDEF)-like protein/PAS domain S-box-containing protein